MFTTHKIEIIKKKNSPIFILFKMWIFLIIIVWLFFYNQYSNFKNKILIEKEISFEIIKWESIKDLSKVLNLNYSFLKLYLKNNDSNFVLFAWNFKILENSNIENILKALKKPIILNEINITLLEWWNIYDIDSYLSSKKLIIKWEYIKYVNSLEQIKKLTSFFSFIEWLKTLEWYLYPDTYTINSENFEINLFVIKQLENFENKAYNKINNNLSLTNKQIEELVNLASIVEKEEKNLEAKPIVAWILKKRLNDWWMIGADITVCYPHKLTSEECKLVVSKYINEKNQYNTRTMTWLPKTPIWNPSFETINATLNSKETPYYFYLHNTETSEIYYWKTNAEHENNKRLYLK